MSNQEKIFESESKETINVKKYIFMSESKETILSHHQEKLLNQNQKKLFESKSRETIQVKTKRNL